MARKTPFKTVCGKRVKTAVRRAGAELHSTKTKGGASSGWRGSWTSTGDSSGRWEGRQQEHLLAKWAGKVGVHLPLTLGGDPVSLDDQISKGHFLGLEKTCLDTCNRFASQRGRVRVAMATSLKQVPREKGQAHGQEETAASWPGSLTLGSHSVTVCPVDTLLAFSSQ